MTKEEHDKQVEKLAVIKSITLKIGKKEVTLTLEEAEQLRNELNSHLGSTAPVYYPRWIYIQQPQAPVYTPPLPWWQQPTCSIMGQGLGAQVPCSLSQIQQAASNQLGLTQ